MDETKVEGLLSAPAAVVEKLRVARMSVYFYEFSGSASWGIYNVVYSYLLTRIGGYSTQTAATYATLEWVMFAIFQFLSNPMWGALSDRIGRRRLLLFGMSGLTMTFLCLCWPNGIWWIFVGAVQGSVDATWPTCNAIIVDCVVAGAAPGDASDCCLIRMIRAVLESRGSPQQGGVVMTHSAEAYLSIGKDLSNDPDAHVSTKVPAAAAASNSDDESLRKRLSVSFIVVWIVAGCGTLSGFMLGLFLVSYATLTLAMASAGLTLIPVLLYSAAFLPETSPLDKREKKLSQLITNEVAESFRVQGYFFRLIFKQRRLCLLSLAYFSVYVAITGVWDLGIFWGEERYGWGATRTTSFLVSITLAPGIGVLLLQLVLVPNLGHSNAIAAISSFSAIASTVLATTAGGGWRWTDAGNLVFLAVVLAAVFWGVYPLLTALLTANVEHASQGHLQGSLFALTTFGSVFALGTYLGVYRLVGSTYIWALTAATAAIAAISLICAGEGDASAEALGADVQAAAAAAAANNGDAHQQASAASPNTGHPSPRSSRKYLV